ncbi:MAG TPA: futalosine hydrolase [Vicinamibacterales bacterium]|nr:futalosine hydrolase [Vicinamibacterales bacterium]
MAVDLLLCVATELEGTLLREQLEGSNPSVAIVRTGVGAVNAAHAVTLFLAQTGAQSIVVCGVGGAYPSSGLRIGDVVCAETECYGDLGATSPSGFLDMKALGFPIVEAPNPLFSEFPMHVFPLDRRVRFVTVASCTGTASAARAIEERTGGAVESMEGAAVAHVAYLHGIPVGEVRGISNIATDRDTSSWRVKEAAVAAQEAVLTWISRR